MPASPGAPGTSDGLTELIATSSASKLRIASRSKDAVKGQSSRFKVLVRAPGGTSANGPALLHDRRPSSLMDGAVDTAAAHQMRVGGIDDDVRFDLGDVALQERDGCVSERQFHGPIVGTDQRDSGMIRREESYYQRFGVCRREAKNDDRRN